MGCLCSLTLIEGEWMHSRTTILVARKIITMSPPRPEGTAVAVRGGRILGVGSVEELKGWGECTVDDRFKDKVVIPGLIEAHCHVMEGVVWQYPYVGYFDRLGPDGRRWEGCRSLEAIVSALKMPEDLVVHHLTFRPMVETNF